jgi:hypothetical protein
VFVKKQLQSLYDKTHKVILQEEDSFCKKILDWIDTLIKDRSSLPVLQDYTSFRDGRHFDKWMRYIHCNQNTLPSLVYRHYVFENISNHPVVNKEYSQGLSLLIVFMTLNRNEYFPLYDTQVWSKVDHQESITNQIRKLSPEIKSAGVDLANRSDITDYQLYRDHACLSSHGLIYGLYLICVVLDFKSRIERNDSNRVLLTGIIQTLTDLKGVLFHVPY